MPMNTHATTIELRERYGEYIMSRDDGLDLGRHIAELLRAGDDVVLDFDATRVISAFLNPAVGDLYAEFDADAVDARVSAINTSESQQKSFDYVKASGRRYYTDPVYRAGVDAARDDLFD